MLDDGWWMVDYTVISTMMIKMVTKGTWLMAGGLYR